MRYHSAVNYTFCLGLAALSHVPQVAAQTQSPAQDIVDFGLARRDSADFISDSGDVTNWLTQGSLNLMLRNYSEFADIVGKPHRSAWVQAMQAQYSSAFTDGIIGVGFDVAPFAAIKLNGGAGAGNMVHVGADGGGADQKAWAYLGTYALKVRLSSLSIRHGLMSFSNPFLESYDIRALPPTFKGTAVTAAPWSELSLYAGTVSAVNARGTTFLSPLTTSYGGVQFSRMNYFGIEWKYTPSGKLVFYRDQAHNVWTQNYFALSQSIGEPTSVKWLGETRLYNTRDQGQQLQGLIDNHAYSVSLTANHLTSSFMLAYQRIVGNQFFDYVQESAGMFLSNAMGTDFGGPHEQSIQLRYAFDGYAVGIPGFQAMAWVTSGWGVSSSAEARRYATPSSLLHDLYWKAGVPIQGGDRELGLKLSYTIKQGLFKEARVSVLGDFYNTDTHYPGKEFRVVRMLVDFPIKVF